jgi:hypothetical protein
VAIGPSYSGDEHIVVAAAASASAAGVCGELLHDRIEMLCAADASGQLAGVQPDDLAEVVAAGNRFEAAVLHAFSTIDSDGPLDVEAIAALARERTRYSLASSCDARRRGGQGTATRRSGSQ